MTSAQSAHARDEAWMRAALALGKQAQGRTAENPAVGCIILDKSGHVVGQGRTDAGGRPHAETVALAMAGKASIGGTAYVSLEPCAHQGQTPPCADALIAAGIKRCVIAAADPDERVNGAGVAKLQAAGIDVQAGVLRIEAEACLSGFLSRVRTGRPHIKMKIAVSADGFIAARAGERTTITGKMAQRWTQSMRSRCDAIMTGSGTATIDDPLLTCRSPISHADSPIRIILDRRLTLSLDSQLVQTAKQVPLWMVIGSDVLETAQCPYLDAGVKFIVAEQVNGEFNLPALFKILGDKGINSILVEAGANLNSSLIADQLADEIYVLQAPKILGVGGLGALAGANGLESVLTDHYIKGIVHNLEADSLVCWQSK